MIVFKNYFKILKKHKGIIILYVAILLLFTLFSTQSSNNAQSFTVTKPDVVIINNDKNSDIVNNIYDYIKDNANIIEIDNDQQKLDDALFYEEVDAIIYIYDGYTSDYLNNTENKIDVKYGSSASSSYVDMLLERYFKIADIVNDNISSQDKIISVINDSLKNTTTVEVKNTLDIDDLSRASYFYDYANYSILAICIYVTSIILIRFNDKKIKNRNNISSKKSSSITKELFLGNLSFILIVWLFIIGLSIYINGNIMFTSNGLFLMLNSLVFMICALSLGFLTGNFFHSESAIGAVVNVVALGSSFICGSFIPTSYLPSAVVKISKLFPSYWYINNNNSIKNIESFNLDNIIPLLLNMGLVLLFAIIFFIITIIYNKKKVRT